MQLILKTPPSQEPLTLDEVKTYLRLPSDQEDHFVEMLITTARAYIERMTGCALLKQRWIMHIKPPYPSSSPLVKCEGKALEIDLPCPPLTHVETVKSAQKEVPFAVTENKVKLMPILWDQEISITYWAGYGDTVAALPPDLKMAILMATRAFYDNQPVVLPLLKPHRVHRVV